MERQTDLLLDRLRCGPITPREALRELGIMRLGARIYDLKSAGHTISRELVKVPVHTSKGGYAHVARYTLEGHTLP
jgi:sigma54-dependent transcription regulator